MTDQIDVKRLKELYYEKEYSMREVSARLGVPQNAVLHFMRKHNLPRRSFSEANAALFRRKEPSFRTRIHLSTFRRELRIAGAMLYWGEGHKSDSGSVIDFTNSDPVMIIVFLNFLRGVYKLDERKFRVLLYCYADQDVEELKRFWSELTNIPQAQFIKPYIRTDFRKNGRKMKHGLVHIRYIDKKLLWAVKGLITEYQSKFGQVVP
jgi:transcriptional regulator with XRE-family HTH domain